MKQGINNGGRERERERRRGEGRCYEELKEGMEKGPVAGNDDRQYSLRRLPPSYGEGQSVMDRNKKSSFQSDPPKAWTPFHLLYFFLLGLCSSARSPSFLSFFYFSPSYLISLVLYLFFWGFFFFLFFFFLFSPGGFICMDVLGVVGWLVD